MGARMVLVPYDKILGLKIVDILKPNMTAIAKRLARVTTVPAATSEPAKTYVLNPTPPPQPSQPAARIDLGRPAIQPRQRIRVGRW